MSECAAASVSNSSIEARLAALESALALPGAAGGGSSSGGEAAAALEARVEKLEETVRKQAYRIVHLTRGFEAKCKEVETLKAVASQP